MYRRLFAIILTMLILQPIILETSVHGIHELKENNGLSIEYIGWYSSVGTSKVYPGSRRLDRL